MVQITYSRSVKRHQLISDLVDQIGTDLHYRNLLQGDQLIGTEKNSIGKSSIEKLTLQLQDLQPLSIPEVQSDLDYFKENFLKRYEERMVPLLEALDPDSGIGYGRSMTDYLQQDYILRQFKKQSNRKKSQTKNTPYHHLAQCKYRQAIQSGVLEVTLSNEDLTELQQDNVTYAPGTFYALGNLLENPSGSTGIKFNLYGYGGLSASNLMTRFAHLDEELVDRLKLLCKSEQQSYPNSILAEIVHLPDARTGNILQRPLLREHEIVLLASSSDQSYGIKANDLYLFIKNQRLILWSKTLDKEIIPRLSSAHNYQNSIYLYRFLGDLQFQGNRPNVKWEWGDLSNNPFLPRISYKDIIVSRARWFIPKLKKRQSTLEEDEKIIQAIINEHKLPRLIMLSEGDNELPLDLTNSRSQHILLENLTKKNLVLHEFLYANYSSYVKDMRGNQYCNEVILPLRTDTRSSERSKPYFTSTNVPRVFPPGSEWVYAKIYCGHQYAEKILGSHLPEIIRKLKSNGILKKWFFIRYKDPEHHIRLRIEGKTKIDNTVIAQTIQETLTPLLHEDLVSGLQFDTYKREIERYSAELIELSEKLFHGDSEYVLQLIEKYPRPEDRWLAAISGIDKLLTAADLNLEQMRDFSEQMRSIFSTEFGNIKENDVMLNKQFRERKAMIGTTLERKDTNNSSIPSKHLRDQSAKALFSNIEKSDLEISTQKVGSLLANHAHMFIDRLFASDQRLHEFATYHLLNNYFRMQIGKRTANVKR